MDVAAFEDDLGVQLVVVGGKTVSGGTSSASSWLFMLLDLLVSRSPTAFSEWKLASGASL